jgi:hypothetical protein
MLRSRERTKCENGATIEKKRLSEDLCYKRKQKNYKLTNAKDIWKKYPKLQLSHIVFCICKSGVELSQILFIIAYV